MKESVSLPLELRDQARLDRNALIEARAAGTRPPQ
jgi:hypothetical protein